MLKKRGFKKEWIYFIGILFVNTIHAKPFTLSKRAPKIPFHVADSIYKIPAEFETFEQKKIMVAFKLEPTLAIAGDFPLFLELKLNRMFSLELGFGYTDYEWNNFLQRDPNYYSALEISPGEDFVYESGQSFRIAPRFYFPSYDVAIAGLYLSPEFLIREYKILGQYKNLIDANAEDDLLWTSTKQRYFNMLVGYQRFVTPHLFFNFYSGLGVRKQFTEELVRNNTTWESVIDDDTKARFLFGIKLGFSIH